MFRFLPAMLRHAFRLLVHAQAPNTLAPAPAKSRIFAVQSLSVEPNCLEYDDMLGTHTREITCETGVSAHQPVYDSSFWCEYRAPSW